MSSREVPSSICLAIARNFCLACREVEIRRLGDPLPVQAAFRHERGCEGAARPVSARLAEIGFVCRRLPA